MKCPTRCRPGRAAAAERSRRRAPNFASPISAEALVYRWDTLVLFKHLLGGGLSQTAIADRPGADHRTAHRWIASGLTDPVADAPRERVRRPAASVVVNAAKSISPVG